MGIYVFIVSQNVSSSSLILIDELGRSTGNREGVGIAHSLCEYLLATKVKTPPPCTPYTCAHPRKRTFPLTLSLTLRMLRKTHANLWIGVKFSFVGCVFTYYNAGVHYDGNALSAALLTRAFVPKREELSFSGKLCPPSSPHFNTTLFPSLCLRIDW